MLKQSYFFNYDQSGRRGHSNKLFKRRSRLDIRKFAFSNRIVDRWNSLSECCVTCNSINCFKSHILSKLEPETTWSVDILESGLYMALSLCPVRRYWWLSVNSVICPGWAWPVFRHDHLHCLLNSIICHPFENCRLAQTSYKLVNALLSTDSSNRQLPGYIIGKYSSNQWRTAEVMEGASVYTRAMYR